MVSCIGHTLQYFPGVNFILPSPSCPAAGRFPASFEHPFLNRLPGLAVMRRSAGANLSEQARQVLITEQNGIAATFSRAPG
jgi:hypothetical protein